MIIPGFLLLNKPAGVSSNYAIEYIKQLLGVSLGVGHAGTLDPFADGLLIIAIGKLATKKLPSIVKLRKEYLACAQLGILTDSLDPTGSVNKRHLYKQVKKEQIQKAVDLVGNTYWQVPPAYSAIKYEGKRLYNLARDQKITTIEMEKILLKKQRIVDIYSIVIQSTNGPFFTLKLEVGAGTYIRSLINDLAIQLDSYATTVKLTRTRIGDYTLTHAVNLFDLIYKDQVIESIQPYFL